MNITAMVRNQKMCFTQGKNIKLEWEQRTGTVNNEQVQTTCAYQSIKTAGGTVINSLQFKNKKL